MRHQQNFSRGFTIVELTIVMVVVAILAVISLSTIPGALVSARDSERRSDIQALARYFEKRYKENASTSFPTYSTTTGLNTDVSKLESGGQNLVLRAPGRSTSSLIAATSTNDQSALVDKNTYIYQPFTSSGALCTVATQASPCVRFKIWYKLEKGTPLVQVVDSRYQQ